MLRLLMPVGEGGGGGGSGGVGDGGLGFEGFAADGAEGEGDGAGGQVDAGGAGELANGFVGGVGQEEGGGGGWEIACEDEAVERPVDVAAGADTLDDLLAEVAAFGEVEGVGLGRLLREIAVADVGGVEGCAFEEAELVEGFGGGLGDAGAGEGFGDGSEGLGGGPELEAGYERAVGVEEVDRGAAGGGVGEAERGEVRGVEAEGGEGCGCGGAGEEEGCGLDGGELDVVHDDEVVEVRDEGGDADALSFEEDGVFEEPGGGIGLDTSLRVEEEGVAALAGLERLDGVGTHAVEPADAVFAGDAEEAEVGARGEAGAGE
jgi:hypothetical protein